jgi:hypothetical protein
MRKVLKAFNRVALIVWLLSAASLDSVSWLPIIVCAVTTLYLAVVILTAQDRLEEVL